MARTMKIPLFGRGGIRDWSLVDYDDFDWLMERRWFLSDTGYAMRMEGGRKNRHKVTMHRLIMGFPTAEVDHINRNKLDNRRSNLRLVVVASVDNQQNVGVRADNTSGYRGVYLEKKTGRWRAEVMLRQRKHRLGGFATPEEADAACKAFRAQHMPFSEDARK